MATIDESAEGKTVVTADGTTVGTVVDADNATAHVEPDPGLTDEIAAELGWGDADEETYQLDNDAVETVTDDEIAEMRTIVSDLHSLTEPKSQMTKAQIEALRLIADGHRHAAAAHMLGISESALKVRLSSARQRLMARTTPEAIQRAKSLNVL